MQANETTFDQLVLRHFDFLRETYGFKVEETTEHWVVLASQVCRVMVGFDRRDLFVDLSSAENEPIRRVRCSLGGLLEIKGAGGPFQIARTLDEHMRMSAELLARFGSDVLAGDWSIRAQVARRYALHWLEASYRDVMAEADHAAREERIEQLAYEYRGQNQEQRRETWNCLDEWLCASDVQKRTFAEWVVANL